jgi:hypothetical protein
VLSLLIGLPDVSLDPVVTFILKVAELLKAVDGVSVNVLLSLVVGSPEVICTQLLLKLLADTCIDPEQLVLAVLLVTELSFIASEKVTEIVVLQLDVLSLSTGLMELKVGATDSVMT